MASREEVLSTLQTQNSRFTNGKVAPSFRGWNRTMQYIFPDIDFAVTIPVRDGIPDQPVEGKVDGAQIVYEMASDTLLAIARKEISGMKAFTQKLVTVKASMPDLLKLQKLDSI